MPVADMPAAEFDVGADLVRQLLEDQHPDLAGLPVEHVAFGWDNAVFRLGSDLGVRMPRRQMGADLVAHEHRWLPELAPKLPLPIPTPLRTGAPGRGYPWPWTVCRWFDGDVAARSHVDGEAAARQLGEFVAALHHPAPADGPTNAYRGVPLQSRAAIQAERFDLVRDVVDDVEVLEAVWADALAAPPWPHPPVWVHGDLHPANIVVRGGEITGVIDFGDICIGDPATDLAVGWMLFDEQTRPRFREHASAAPFGVDDPSWRRARGWAVALGVACVASSADNPLIASVGRRALAAVIEDQRSGELH